MADATKYPERFSVVGTFFQCVYCDRGDDCRDSWSSSSWACKSIRLMRMEDGSCVARCDPCPGTGVDDVVMVNLGQAETWAPHRRVL